MADINPVTSTNPSDHRTRQRSGFHGTDPSRDPTAYFTVTVPPAETAVETRHARGPDGRLFLAQVMSGGSVRVYPFGDDDATVATGTPVSPETADVTSCSLGVRSSGLVDLLYVKAGNVLRRQSRDQGATFSAAEALHAGYSLVVHWLDDATGELGMMLYSDADNSWYFSLGVLDDPGLTWTLTTPSVVVAGAKKPGQLRRFANERWNFSYTTAAGELNLLHCAAMPDTGIGTWEPLAAAVATGYSFVTHWQDEKGGLLVMLAYATATSRWMTFAGEYSDDGTTVTFASPVAVFPTGTQFAAAASVRQRSDGRWEFSRSDGVGASAFARCKALTKTGTGTWGP